MANNFEQSHRGNPRRDELSTQEGAGQELSREEEAKSLGHLVFPNNPRAANLLMRDILGLTTEEELDGYFTEEEKAELRGYFVFPDNPRAASLLKRSILGLTTEEEEAELDGYFVFPDNPRAASLLKRDILGLTTEKEKTELRGYLVFPDNPRAASLLKRSILGLTTEEEKTELRGYLVFPDNLRAADLLKRSILGLTTEEEKTELRGYLVFPNNLRAASLLMRDILGLTTEEEKAELRGYLVFPDNPEAASLLTKDILGQATEEEKAELRKYFQRKQFSPKVNSLWDKVEAGDPNVKQVAMSQGGAIKVSPTDPEKIIWTFCLGGYYACLVFTEHPDGTRNAVLTHYPATEIPQNLTKLRELIDQSEEMKGASIKQVVLIMPGEWVQDPITKKYSFGVQDQQTASSLASDVQDKLGSRVEVRLEPYSVGQMEGKKDEGIFLVYIPPKGEGVVRYETWFSDGTLGTQEPKN